MKVKMLTDAPGSPDGVTVNQYHEGEVHEVTEALGEAFLRHGLAEAVKVAPSKRVPEPETLTKKDVGPGENKSDA